MPSLSSHRLYSAGLLVGFIVGCASGGKSASSPSPSPQAGTTVTSQDIHPAPNEPIEKVLQGRISGVTVTQAADGGIAIQIRGQSSALGATSLNGRVAAPCYRAQRRGIEGLVGVHGASSFPDLIHCVKTEYE